MSSFWRKVCKGMFYVSFAVSEIGVIIGSSIMMSEFRDYWWIGFVVMLFAGFFVIMLHAFLGAALEMMYNIAALRKKLCGVNEETSANSNDVKAVRRDSEIKHIIAKVKPEENKDSTYVPWTCPKCGQDNEAENQYCSNCGYDIDSES